MESNKRGGAPPRNTTSPTSPLVQLLDRILSPISTNCNNTDATTPIPLRHVTRLISNEANTDGKRVMSPNARIAGVPGSKSNKQAELLQEFWILFLKDYLPSLFPRCQLNEKNVIQFGKGGSGMPSSQESNFRKAVMKRRTEVQKMSSYFAVLEVIDSLGIAKESEKDIIVFIPGEGTRPFMAALMDLYFQSRGCSNSWKIYCMDPKLDDEFVSSAFGDEGYGRNIFCLKETLEAFVERNEDMKLQDKTILLLGMQSHAPLDWFWEYLKADAGMKKGICITAPCCEGFGMVEVQAKEGILRSEYVIKKGSSDPWNENIQLHVWKYGTVSSFVEQNGVK